VTTDDVQARFDDIERRIKALEARATPAGEAASPPATAGGVPEWLQPLDAIFKSGKHASALTQADKLRQQAYASSSTTHLEQLHAYLSGVRTVEHLKLGRVLFAINQNVEMTRGRDAGDTPPPAIRSERRHDLQPFPAPKGSMPAAGDGAGDAGED
jgi:hypothetical protein